MAITYRLSNETRLSVAQMDNNFHYVEEQISGITASIATLNTNLATATASIATITAKYKVYTAFLSQNGGTSPITIYNNTSLVIGTTYQIVNTDGDTVDFTNVGAPDNNYDTFFVATGTTPNSWGDSNSGELNYNEGAPVATVLENTIGNVWWEWQSTGSFLAKSDDLFTEGKTIAFISQSISSEMTVPVIAYTYDFNLNRIQIETYDSNGDPSPNVLNRTPIEIRVYN